MTPERRSGARYARLLGLAAFAVASWATGGNATPPERTPPVVPVEISAPEALVRRIYTLPDPDVGAFIDPQRRPAFYTSRIHARALRMERCYTKKYGMDFLDIDYIVPGNDYDITDLSFTLVNSTRRAATINVRFNRSAGAIDPISLFYHLKLTRGGWRIDDVAYEKETLAKSLSGKC